MPWLTIEWGEGGAPGCDEDMRGAAPESASEDEEALPWTGEQEALARDLGETVGPDAVGLGGEPCGTAPRDLGLEHQQLGPEGHMKAAAEIPLPGPGEGGEDSFHRAVHRRAQLTPAASRHLWKEAKAEWLRAEQELAPALQAWREKLRQDDPAMHRLMVPEEGPGFNPFLLGRVSRTAGHTDADLLRLFTRDGFGVVGDIAFAGFGEPSGAPPPRFSTAEVLERGRRGRNARLRAKMRPPDDAEVRRALWEKLQEEVGLGRVAPPARIPDGVPVTRTFGVREGRRPDGGIKARMIVDYKESEWNAATRAGWRVRHDSVDQVVWAARE